MNTTDAIFFDVSMGKCAIRALENRVKLSEGASRTLSKCLNKVFVFYVMSVESIYSLSYKDPESRNYYPEELEAEARRLYLNRVTSDLIPMIVLTVTDPENFKRLFEEIKTPVFVFMKDPEDLEDKLGYLCITESGIEIKEVKRGFSFKKDDHVLMVCDE